MQGKIAIELCRYIDKYSLAIEENKEPQSALLVKSAPKKEVRFVNFYSPLSNSKTFEDEAKKVAEQFQYSFLQGMMIMADMKEIPMEFDHHNNIIIGRFEIPDSKWGRFFKEMERIKGNFTSEGREVLFTNNASKSWGSLKSSVLAKVKFSKARYTVTLKNI